MTDSTPPAAPARDPLWLRLLPHPLISLVILAAWLVLDGNLTPANVLLGAFLAWALPRMTRRFWRHPVHVRSWTGLVRFAIIVIWDIITANLQAVRLLLKSPQELKPAFFVIHLELTNPVAITVLANTITLTPGTVSADLSSRQERLLVHGLHVPDVEAAIAQIKARYEAPLKEIF
ncbi:MAG: Na+/H+ antiporter subunit E [Natronospirillum sp.]|uniref:Na+/H+ antiporter subunit E n=1 Tax=Natronospirillum sp. TaxID=2812955 RepID=UPI0025E4A8A9|nr:Na+/H+ antiporter subunit E [Natronospirillum sp.]MCH8551425.1 Na+/H+ antiporter subunit E [Natronospirillum sp.]